MQANELYIRAADLFLPHVPWTWTTVDDVVEHLENRGMFNQPGFCESRVLRKVLVYQALLQDPACVQMVSVMGAFGAATMIRRVA